MPEASAPAATDSPAVELTLLIPVHNEEGGVEQVVRDCHALLTTGVANLSFEIIAIDDGSRDGSPAILERLAVEGLLRVHTHAENRGYGAALKTGIRHARGAWIGMIDADRTYPPEALPLLIAEVRRGRAMVVAARIGQSVHIPLVRRPAKWMLRMLAEYLTQARIPDLNSGLRLMDARHVREFMRLLPNGFSFTTTITLAMLTRGYDVVYLPINYHKRVGTSGIRPIRDTLKFLQLIIRTVLCFNPLRIFVPVAVLLGLAAVLVAVVSKVMFGELADVTSVVLLVTAVQMLGIGMLADLIDRRLD